MLKKASHKNDVVNVAADNPVGTMDRFAMGLRRVLAAPKSSRLKRTRKRRKPT